MSPRERQLADGLAAARARLAAAATAAGRDVAGIELLVVTKYFPASDVLILAGLGCRAFGESREQEAAAKAAEVAAELGSAAQSLRWHMVGRIQRNKARAVAGWADAAHSVDGEKLVAALNRGALAALADGRRAEPLRVYVQISLDGDASRGGVDVTVPGEVDRVCAVVADAPGLVFAGLMGIPPLGADAGAAFGKLSAERHRVGRSYPQLLGLSAGMSADLESAVEHGSTCVRVGTAVMGHRPLISPGSHSSHIFITDTD